MKKALNQAKILNISVNSTTRQEVLTTIGNGIRNKEKFVVLTPNPEIIMAAQADSELASILNNADLSIPDGIGLKLANPNLPIYKGRQLMLDLFALADSLKAKVFLLGASQKTNKLAVERVKKEYKNIKIKGNPGPKLDINAVPLSKSNIVSEINNFAPNFLFVAFGTPKEQKWIAQHRDELKANCIMEVGGALDYFSGVALLPPKILEKLGLEWLWRFINEPSRASRIFTALVLFPIRIILSKIAS